jgi:hypothetical protein
MKKETLQTMINKNISGSKYVSVYVNNNNSNDHDNSNSIKFLFICLLTQQPMGQLQSEHE